MSISAAKVDQIRHSINRDRLVDTAVKLVEVPSPTCSAGEVSDRLESLLRADGFEVERVAAGWPDAPAVVARYNTGQPGRVLQFNGHLDTVHLPFVPPRVENGMLYGSGASDMKGGVAAMYEAMRVLRDAGLLGGGGILLTAHDLHESPWGDGSQVATLIDEGYVGDAVMLPEYLATPLPVAGRGLAVVRYRVRREGEPVHEVLGGIAGPSVIAAGARLVDRIMRLDDELAAQTHPIAGRASAFLGQIHSGEIFNQSPQELILEGTRRWLPGMSPTDVEADLRATVAEVSNACDGISIDLEWTAGRDAYEIDPQEPVIAAFQSGFSAVTGNTLGTGAKPFCDDGNSFVARGGIPAITHGPDARGAHTLDEEVAIDELVRVAVVYALTAIGFCSTNESRS